MQAWRIVTPGGPLTLCEVEPPVPKSGEFVLAVKAAGLCHSDVAIIEGPGQQWLAHIPITLGHEVAGIVEAVGPDTVGVRVGDRAAILSLGFGNCPGISRDGGYAERTIGRVDSFVQVPDELDFAQAAVGTDAGMTAHHAVRVAKVGHGTRLGIIGLGGLGAIGARIGVLLGAEVWAAEPRADVRDAGAHLGVLEIFPDAAGFLGLDLDVVIDFAGFGTTTATAIQAVRQGGTVVLVGLGVLDATISTNSLVTREVRLIGSLGGTREDVEAVFRLMASGDLVPATRPIDFRDIDEALQELRDGGRAGRLVARFPN